MAKMFYTLEEAAEKLGKTEDQVKELSASGQLQQFRDGDKLMFKRDQVDSMTAGGDSDASDTGLGLASDDTDTISLDDADNPSKGKGEDAREATGVSVFDAGEVDMADPMAQTQVASSSSIDDEELALESVGSGSGLLDLTRESDDTSLGAELLDEIYPGEASDAKLDAGVASSGAFDAATASMETGASGPSGLENLTSEPAAEGAMTMASTHEAAEASDPVGSGLGAGMLFGAMIALILGLIVAISAVTGVPSKVTSTMTQSTTTLGLFCGGLLVLSIVLGVVGMVIGKATAR